MPSPKKGESREKFVQRCIPVVIREGTAKNNKQAVAVCNSMWEQKVTKNESALQHIAFNAAPTKADVKIKRLEGREHYVVPMVMLTEGVHAGNKGPLYYSAEELSKSPSAWDHKPIVVYHPEDDRSACRPTILNSQKVGIILNTRWDKKLKAEAWIDKKRANKVDARIIEAIEEGRVMELSTGLMTENEDEPGVWNTEKYDGIAKNLRPDHLALLPDKRGACSVEDGAGLLMNEMSFSNISHTLSTLLEDKYGYSAYVSDVFEKFFIYQRKNNLYQMNYKVKDDEIELEGESKEVVRVTEYRTKKGEVIGNSGSGLTERDDLIDNGGVRHAPGSKKKVRNMPKSKKQLVDELVSNEATQWEDKHRKFLSKFSEAQLSLMMPVLNADTGHPTVPEEGRKPGQNKDNQMTKDLPPEEESEALQSQEGNEKPTAGKKNLAKEKEDEGKTTKNTDFQSLLENADPQTRDFIKRGINAHMEQRSRLIQTITANKACKYTEKQLQGFDTDLLENMAAMAQASAPAPASKPRHAAVGAGIYDYSGAGGMFVENEEEEDEILDLPVMNFDKEEDEDED